MATKKKYTLKKDNSNIIINNEVIDEKKQYLQKGDIGDDVKELQEKLIELGYSVGVDGADGEFGINTENAVIKFQTDNLIEVDGVVGKETLNAIDVALKKSKLKIYRIRKAWNEPRTQVGAYTNLDTAIKDWNKLPNGYKVYDNNGIIVYPENSDQEKRKDNPFKPIILPARTYSDVALGMAAKDERGGYSGGQAGDQSGREVYILETWYYQNWTSVLRPTDPELAEKIAQAMEAACENPNIGYDQSQRNTLYTQAKMVNLNLSRITSPCECDCSSLVSICCICAGLPENLFFSGGNMCTTWTLEDACLKTGKFVNLTDSKYTTQKNYLQRGDILLNRDQHVVVVLGNGKNADTPTSSQTSMLYKVKVDVNVLNVRAFPSGTSPIVGRIYKDATYTITAIEGGWGKLRTKNGWINLEFVSQVK